MAGPFLFDRVQESSTTLGPGPLTLEGPVSGYRSFASVLAVGDTCPYRIEEPAGANWEVGIGALTGVTTFARGSGANLLASSNGNQPVNFPAGTKHVGISYPAGRAVLKAAAFTAGSVLFANANGELAQDNVALFWDAPNDRLGIGTTAPAVPAHVLLNNATTAAVDYLFALGHDSTGTPAAGFGAGVKVQLESDTTAAQDAFTLDVTWATPTHATRKARAVFSAFDTAARECLRLEADGTTGRVGIGGAVSASAALNVNGDVAITTLTAGSIPFAGTGGLISQSNAQLFWDNAQNFIGIGTNTPISTITAVRSSAVTSTTRSVMEFFHNSTNTPAAGFGGKMTVGGKSSTTDSAPMATIEWVWIVSTHASRTARLRLLVSDFNSTSREGLRIDADGTQALVGFFGTAAAAQQTITGSRGGNAALASLLTGLANLGLIIDSTTA